MMRASYRAITASLISTLLLGSFACSSSSLTRGSGDGGTGGDGEEAVSGGSAGRSTSSSGARAGETSFAGRGGHAGADTSLPPSEAGNGSLEGGAAGSGGGAGAEAFGGSNHGSAGALGIPGGQGGVSANGGGAQGGSLLGGGAAGRAGAMNGGGGATQNSGGTHQGGSAGAAGALIAQGGMAPGHCAVPSDCNGLFDQTYCAAATCENGLCHSQPLATLGTASCTGGCSTSTPTTGFWDGDVPYVLHVPYRGTEANETVAIQRLRLDSSDNGTRVPFALRSDLKPPTRLAAAMSGTSLGILYGTQQMNSSGSAINHTTQFALTTLAGTAATPVVLATSTVSSEYTYPALQLYAVPRANSQWLLAQFDGDPIGYWDGFSGAISAGSGLSRIEGLYDDHAGMGILDDVVLLSGHAYYYWKIGGTQDILVRRYTVSDLSLLGSDIVLDHIETGTVGEQPIVMVRLGAAMGVMWNVKATTGIVLGTAIIAKDGTFVKAPTKANSTLIAKALVANPKGGALLVASQVDTSGTTPQYTPVVQTVSAELAPTGPSYAIGPKTAYDLLTVGAWNSADGKKTLITYTRNDTYATSNAYRRIVDTALCQ